MMRHIKLFAVIIAAVILTAALSACKISISNKDNNGGGLGDIVVGGSSMPDQPNTPTSEPMNGKTNAPTTQPPETQPPNTAEPWTGSWVGAPSWNNIILTQNGSNVTGTYGMTSGGVIEGTVSGNVFTGKWVFLDGRTGMVQLTMTNDGYNLEIRWSNDSTTTWLDSVSVAIRGTSPIPITTTEPWAGSWVGAQSWNNIILTQNGSNVTGTYGITSGGVIEGDVSGNIFTGKWTYSDGRTGMVQFTMINNSNGLEIRWSNDSTTTWLDSVSVAIRQTSVMSPSAPPNGWGTDDLRIIGDWFVWWDGNSSWKFYEDGAFIRYNHFTGNFRDSRVQGFYSYKNGVLWGTAQWSYATHAGWEDWGFWENFSYHKAEIGIVDSDSSFAGKEFLSIYRTENSTPSVASDIFVKDRNK